MSIISDIPSPRELCVDLGTGHGAVARALATLFKSVIGVDSSKGMLKQAAGAQKSDVSNIQHHQSNAESLPFIASKTVDLVIACQAAHWFDPEPLWKEMTRIVRPGGTVVFWNWGHYVVMGRPQVNRALQKFFFEDLVPYWPQPGISVFNNEWMYPVECRDFANWTDLTRLVSVPADDDAPGVLETPGATLGSLETLIRTLSMIHEWRKAQSEALSVKEGGYGDCVDTLMRDMIEGDKKWRAFVTPGGDWRDIEVDLEMRSILLMARRKQSLSYCADPHQR
ncbi:S-adenosyl-L-methionine-dependent methyltransferase [Aspergillus eucalypticola CBS 122712]|uniref:S-adenosyl-L-methionine-dependent methyltransferase n=1 Tax=Aspergillus eucalypticola (strain CBS 122712 / IBT 29274) TaxID=1448314 RepID=A0A317UPQ6_ASPEC|nr:S-adenosyl-L-methionine-dependent methyltransferase [Aspergillus eucalypticola CBS 122712]PWY63983.1 S-adenosyl-L-methionine-dependent methyltransferase [Aspergillus eucalypticola CBS 122712]